MIHNETVIANDVPILFNINNVNDLLNVNENIHD